MNSHVSSLFSVIRFYLVQRKAITLLHKVNATIARRIDKKALWIAIEEQDAAAGPLVSSAIPSHGTRLQGTAPTQTVVSWNRFPRPTAADITHTRGGESAVIQPKGGTNWQDALNELLAQLSAVLFGE